MALGCEVHHGVRAMRCERRVDLHAVGDVAAQERVARTFLEVAEVLPA
jgi:hypothetical protein